MWAVARRRGAIDVDVDIAPAGQPFGQRRGDAGHGLDDRFDAFGGLVDRRQIRSPDLDTYRALDPGREHIDAVEDRGHPEICEPRHAEDRTSGVWGKRGEWSVDPG